MSPLNHKRTTSSLAPPIICVAKKIGNNKDRRLLIVFHKSKKNYFTKNIKFLEPPLKLTNYLSVKILNKQGDDYQGFRQVKHGYMIWFRFRAANL